MPPPPVGGFGDTRTADEKFGFIPRGLPRKLWSRACPGVNTIYSTGDVSFIGISLNFGVERKPMRIFTTTQVRAIDAYTIQNEPVASVDLMERAAMQICVWLTKHYNQSYPFVIFAVACY